MYAVNSSRVDDWKWDMQYVVSEVLRQSSTQNSLMAFKAIVFMKASGLTGQVELHVRILAVTTSQQTCLLSHMNYLWFVFKM